MKKIYTPLATIVLSFMLVSASYAQSQTHDRDGAVSDAAKMRTVTSTYIQGRRGYDGLDAIWLAQSVPDNAINRDDLIVGWIYETKPNEELRGLIKFNDLDIPADATIIRVELSLMANQVIGTPKLGVYGLLKDFQSSSTVWGHAKLGESTWNSQHHGLGQGQGRWGKPGADLPGDGFSGPVKGDRLASADEVKVINNTGRHTFDVTASFREQFAARKMFGWLIRSETRQPGHYVTLREHQTRLVVTYMPHDASEILPPKATDARLIGFNLAYASDITQNVNRARELPFHGATFYGVPDDNGQRWLCNSVMGPDPLSIDDYSQFIESMRTIQSHTPLKHNFLRVNLTVPGTLEKQEKPYTWDTRPRGSDRVTMWWDDGFDVVVENMKVAAGVAKEGNMAGLFLDWESYGGHIFSFEKQKDAAARHRSRHQTLRQVYKRASQLTRAINEIYPDMTIIVIFHLYDKDDNDMWNAFCDGLMASSDPRMSIVNGNESEGYRSVSEAEFQRIYDWHYEEGVKFSSVPQKYLRQTEVGFGVWLNWKGWGEDAEFFSSSAVWQTKLENALMVSDGYVWVFTEGSSARPTPNWWTGTHLPPAYLNATRNALELTARRKASN